MMKYALNRLLLLIPTLLGVLLLTFVIIQFTPGDPVLRMLGNSASPERVAQVREQLGLDDPLLEQYLRYIIRAVSGDLGVSIRGSVPVARSIMERFPSTLALALAAVLIGATVGVSMGLLAATTKSGWLKNGILFLSITAISIPNFWVGILLIIVFGVQLGWISVTGADGFLNLLFPAFTLALPLIGTLTRVTQSAVMDELGKDYIRTAYSKGLSRLIVYRRHLVRNALIPVITIIGLEFGGLLGGAVIIEAVFARPGLGLFAISAVNGRDYPQLQGMVLFLGTVYVLVNLIVDLSYGLLDPRVRYS